MWKTKGLRRTISSQIRQIFQILFDIYEVWVAYSVRNTSKYFVRRKAFGEKYANEGNMQNIMQEIIITWFNYISQMKFNARVNVFKWAHLCSFFNKKLN